MPIPSVHTTYVRVHTGAQESSHANSICTHRIYRDKGSAAFGALLLAWAVQDALCYAAQDHTHVMVANLATSCPGLPNLSAVAVYSRQG